MKYTIERTFSLKNENFEILCDAKTFCTAKATPSKEYKGRYNIKLSNPINKYIGEDICFVEPDPNNSQSYFIYLQNGKKRLFGQLFYQFCGYDNYLYTIIFGEKLYQVRSSDLKDHPLTIIDTIQSTNSSGLDYPETLFQVIEPFSKLNKKYHVTINHKKWQYGYLAFVILLELHERKQK